MQILFQGDSITDAMKPSPSEYPNRSLGNGYVYLITARLCTEMIDRDIEVFNRGIGGDMTTDLYARWQKDTLNFDFDILSLLCGINDIGFRRRLGIGNSVEKFAYVYDRLIYEAKEKRPEAGIVLMAPFIFKMHDYNGEFGDDIFQNYNEWESDIRREGEIVEKIAQKYDALFIPLMDIFEKWCAKYPAEKFSIDCIHPTAIATSIIADEWISAVKKNKLI